VKVDAMNSETESKPLLEVVNLQKEFTVHNLGGKQIQGFWDVSFKVAKGRVLALTGPSGIGKSSVLKCIYRTYLSSAGNIYYRSKLYGEVDLTCLPEYQMLQLRAFEIGYATQFLKVLPRVPAIDVAAEPVMGGKMPPNVARESARHLLERLKIPEELYDAFPVTFSGGEQQRVNIACSIIAKPRMLLLDEPIASLDSESIDIIIDMLKELRAQGTTMIIVSHNTKILEALADQVYRIPLKDMPGEVIELGGDEPPGAQAL
jgi:alpha-D-ribose 1-methylphosphonate 5-triphosphate synthase subunit PhnL